MTGCADGRDRRMWNRVQLRPLLCNCPGTDHQCRRSVLPGKAPWICQRDNGNIVDAAADNQRLRDAGRDAVVIGADLCLHPQDGIVIGGANKESRRQHDPIILGLAVDMLDAVDALDDRFQWLGQQFDRVG